MKLALKFNFFLYLMLLFYSCGNVFHPEAEIPTYINIPRIDVSVTDPYVQGTASNKIVDAWVFIDDDLQGVYELPASFPVLGEGIHSLKIKAGIKDNGIAATRVQYPFFDFYINNSFRSYPDSVQIVSPVVEYSSSASFPWIEDFEDPVISLDSAFPSSLKMERVIGGAFAFEGNASGFVSLDTVKYIFKGVSDSAFVLPKGGTSVYLELNYKTTANLDVYLVSDNPGGPEEEYVLRLTPTNKTGVAGWNKIYVNLTYGVSANPDAANYKVSFYSNIVNDGVSSAEIYLDNIKLVHF